VTSKQPFESVVAAHGATVLRVCRAVLGSVDADDAWSETFLSAMKAYPELPAEANVVAWLVTIAHRKAIDVARGIARRARTTAEVPESVTEHHPDRVDVELDLVAALARLPEKQRQAVAYHYLGGLPYREVAAILGGTTDAARRAAADGVSNLRRTHSDTAEKRVLR
jgi:RNA polymerase sigma factor (sigma-70 family)